MVSGQVILYQKVSLVDPVGAVNVCARLESPFVGLVEPSWAQDEPLWQPDLTAVAEAPLAVTPVRPDSKVPLVMPEGGGGGGGPPAARATSSKSVKVGSPA